MEIIRTSANLNKKEMFALTKSKNTKKMSEAEGVLIELQAWALYEDVNKKDNSHMQVLAILDKDGTSYATNSPTFTESFLEIVDFFDSDEVHTILVCGGTSNNGRHYYYCEYKD